VPPESAEVLYYRFRDLELDGDSLELRRGGEPVPLRPKAAKVLRLLVMNAGKLVSREEIRDAVWGVDTEVDFDHSLHTAIRQVRAALGESGENADLIQTYPRRGYRFEAQVELVEQATGAQRPEASAARSVPFGLSLRSGLLAAALIVVAVTVFGQMYGGVRPEPQVSQAGQEHIAVLPFRLLSTGDGGGDLARSFTAGLNAELIGALNTLTDQGYVIMATAVGSVASEPQESDLPPSADLMLSGTVQLVGQELHVTAQLLRVVDGLQLWAGSFNGTLEQIMAMPETISTEIVDAVAGHAHGSLP